MHSSESAQIDIAKKLVKKKKLSRVHRAVHIIWVGCGSHIAIS